jgi:hypothetical protein
LRPARCATRSADPSTSATPRLVASFQRSTPVEIVANIADMARAAVIKQIPLPVLSTPGPNLIFVDSQMILERLTDATQEIREQLDARSNSIAVKLGAAAGLTGAVSLGYTLWIVRGGSLLASVLSSLPVWRLLDPLAVLQVTGGLDGAMEGPNKDEDDDDDEQRLARMLR